MSTLIKSHSSVVHRAEGQMKTVRISKFAIVAIVSVLIHVLIIVGLGFFTISVLNEPAPELFEAPPDRVVSEPIKVQIRPKLNKSRPNIAKPIEIMAVNLLEVPQIDVDLPRVSNPVSIARGWGTGGFSGMGGDFAPATVKFSLGSFGTTEHIEHGFTGKVYLYESIDRLRDGDKWFEGEGRRRASKRIYNYALHIPSQDFDKGFPGITKQFEWFAIDFEAQVNWPEKFAGEYEFELASDDGSILQIDGVDVIDLDGMHGMSQKTGRYSLNAGMRAFRVAYFQGPAHQLGLTLRYRLVGSNQWEIFDLTKVLPYQ